MNFSLQKEIIAQIAKRLEFAAPKEKAFLLKETLDFEEDEKLFKNRIWGVSTKVDNGLFKLLIGDLDGSEKIGERIAIIQLDNFPSFGVRFSTHQEDAGVVCFQYEKQWIECSTLFQAKLLVAVESLGEILLNWSPLEKYQDILKSLVSFVEFQSDE